MGSTQGHATPRSVPIDAGRRQLISCEVGLFLSSVPCDERRLKCMSTRDTACARLRHGVCVTQRGEASRDVSRTTRSSVFRTVHKLSVRGSTNSFSAHQT